MEIIKYTGDDNRTYKRVIGDNGEEAVISKMVKSGYRLLARNYAVHNIGELDSVFTKDGDIYVVEVKSRIGGNYYSSPEEAITNSKYRKLMKTAQIFVNKHRLFDSNIIFLIGAVTHNRDGLIQNVEIIPF